MDVAGEALRSNLFVAIKEVVSSDEKSLITEISIRSKIKATL